MVELLLYPTMSVITKTMTLSSINIALVIEDEARYNPQPPLAGSYFSCINTL